MIGAIAGDIIGSVYEANPIKTTDFPLFREDSVFTDDTILTVAIAAALTTGEPYLHWVRRLARAYPDAGYGGSFQQWLQTEPPTPYNSWGNGSAMRVSPVAYAFSSETEVLRQARGSAEITHNHPEGIKGAQAIALAVFLARCGRSKVEIRDRIQATFGYDLDRNPDDIRPSYSFDVSCQGSVPVAIIASLHAESYEEAVRIAISFGGDSDTLACMAGAIAEALYGVPEFVVCEVKTRLPPQLWALVDTFARKYRLVL